LGEQVATRRASLRVTAFVAAAAGGLLVLAAAGAAGPGASGALEPTRQRACPTFRVVEPDPAAGYRAGVYDLSVSGPITCRGAVRLFRRYLRHPDSRLPRGWRHRRHYAGFANRRAAFNVYQPLRRTTRHSYGAVRLCHPAASVFPTERVGFRPGHHALLAWGRTRCARARAAFRSYARRGVVPAPYRLDRHRTAFSVRAVRGRSRERHPKQAVGALRETRPRPVEGAPGVGQPRSPAGRSGFQVAYRDYALQDPQPGSPDPNDQCAQGEFDFYVCVQIFNNVGGSGTFTNVSESHSCGLTDPGPAPTIPVGTAPTYRVHCAVGFWGSIHYDISFSTGTQGATGGIDISYSTFDGTFTCQTTGDVTDFLSCDPDGGSMLPENGHATFENWHYSFAVGLRP
jgi:hypothetical protein